MEYSAYKLLLENQDLTVKELLEKLNIEPKSLEPKEIRERYDYMLNKVVEILKNGYTVKLANVLEVPGNNKLMFHFYSPKQVIGDLRKYFDMSKFIVSDNYAIVDASELGAYSMQLRWRDVWKAWSDWTIPPRIIESYIDERFVVTGEIISYQNNKLCS